VSVLSVRVGAIMPGRNPESCFSSTIPRKPYARMTGHGPDTSPDSPDSPDTGVRGHSNVQGDGRNSHRLGKPRAIPEDWSMGGVVGREIGNHEDVERQNVARDPTCNAPSNFTGSCHW